MSRNLFRPDSGLMITMNYITDCIFLSIFWLLSCFLVVTIGPGSAALYDSVSRGMRQGSKHAWSRFYSSFRQNLKSGILPGLLVVAGGAVVGWALIQVWNGTVAGSISWMLFAAAVIAAGLVLGMLSLVLPVLSRFENSLGALLKNSMLLGLANAPRTVLLGLINGISIYLCARFVIPLFFLPALAVLLGSFLVEPMFAPFEEA